MQPHAFELASMVATIGNQNSMVATIGDQNSMVAAIGIWLPIVLPFGQADMESNPVARFVSSCQFCHHAGKPLWNATARLRARLDGSNDW